LTFVFIIFSASTLADALKLLNTLIVKDFLWRLIFHQSKLQPHSISLAAIYNHLTHTVIHSFCG